MPAARGAIALAVARDHPAYAGHFPGEPILPAVVLLAEVLAAVAQETGSAPHAWKVAQAKFLAAVGPGEGLMLAIDALGPRLRGGDEAISGGDEAVSGGDEAVRGGYSVSFEVRSGGTVVARGTLARA